MGGAANTAQRVATGVATLGASELPGAAGNAARNLALPISLTNPLGAAYGAAAATRMGAGIQTLANAPRDAQRAAEAAQQEQSRQAAALQDKLLQQPKQIAPDNFLAMKNKMLLALRGGMAGNLPAAGGAPSAVLSAPSLTGNGGGKPRLGS